MYETCNSKLLFYESVGGQISYSDVCAGSLYVGNISSLILICSKIQEADYCQYPHFFLI